MKLAWTVPEGAEPQKLRNFVRGTGRLSASLWKRIKWNGRVTVNGEAVHNAKLPVSPGDRICCEWTEESEIIPADIPLSILYEDDWFLVVNKGIGMIIHPTHKDITNTLVNAVAGYYEASGQHAGIHPVYRLDRNTTGLVVVAKSAKIQYDLTRSHDQITRRYVALASGHLQPAVGLIDAPIGRKEGSIIEWQVREDGRPARTAYQVAARGGDFDVVRLRLYTGRTHQIRVHLSHLGHPLLGDDLYGGPCGRIRRQALHAETASFVHPATGRLVSFSAPLPEDMAALIRTASGEEEL